MSDGFAGFLGVLVLIAIGLIYWWVFAIAAAVLLAIGAVVWLGSVAWNSAALARERRRAQLRHEATMRELDRIAAEGHRRIRQIIGSGGRR